LPQTNTITSPGIIPHNAPCDVNFFQYNESKIIGPNEAPNPAHENDTILRIDSLFGHARKIAITETTSTAIRPKNTYCLSDASVLMTALYKSSINAEDVTIN